MEGWIKLYRKFLNWEWYEDNNTKIVFLHLLLTANHVDKKWKGITIKRGERLTSINNLSEEIHLKNQQTRTALNKLKSTNEITTKSTNKYTLITIEKYNDYQVNDNKDNKQNNKQITNEQQTNNNQNNKRVTTTKERKEDKNVKNKIKEKEIKRKRVVELYNSTTPLLPSVKKITQKRKKSIDKFLEEFTIKQFKEICKIANSSEFLTGNNERRLES